MYYTWYTVKVIEQGGTVTWEVKAIDEDHARRIIKDRVREQNLRVENTYLPIEFRFERVIEVLWDTLCIDRVCHHRLP